MTHSAYASGPFQSPVTESQLQPAWVQIKGIYWLMKLRKSDSGSGIRSSGLCLLSQAGSFFMVRKMATGNLDPIYPFSPWSKRWRSSFPALICQSHRRVLTGTGLHHISEVKRKVAHESGKAVVRICIPQDKTTCTLHLSWVYIISKQVNCGLATHTPNNCSFHFYICLARNSQHLNGTWLERGFVPRNLHIKKLAMVSSREKGGRGRGVVERNGIFCSCTFSCMVWYFYMVCEGTEKLPIKDREWSCWSLVQTEARACSELQDLSPRPLFMESYHRHGAQNGDICGPFTQLKSWHRAEGNCCFY